jgi:TonB family protein
MQANVIRIIALFVVAAGVSINVSAQRSSCDLRLKVYSYDVVDSARSRLQNVQARLRGRNIDRTLSLGLDANSVFADLVEGRYEVEFSKAGYTKRKRSIVLDCALKDEKNAVWDHTYLWRDKKSSAVEADLVEEPKDDDSGNVPGTAGIGTRDVASAAADKLVGSVRLNITIDEDGNVIEASRLEGDEKLASRAISLARRAKFTPTLVSGKPMRVTGSITYNFIP